VCGRLLYVCGPARVLSRVRGCSVERRPVYYGILYCSLLRTHYWYSTQNARAVVELLTSTATSYNSLSVCTVSASQVSPQSHMASNLRHSRLHVSTVHCCSLYSRFLVSLPDTCRGVVSSQHPRQDLQFSTQSRPLRFRAAAAAAALVRHGAGKSLVVEELVEPQPRLAGAAAREETACLPLDAQRSGVLV
jgi:hypothetical protein